MTEPPRIVPRSEVEQARRYVASYDAAAGSYANQLSAARDDVDRARINKKLDQARRQAEFYRGIIASAAAEPES